MQPKCFALNDANRLLAEVNRSLNKHFIIDHTTHRAGFDQQAWDHFGLHKVYAYDSDGEMCVMEKWDDSSTSSPTEKPTLLVECRANETKKGAVIYRKDKIATTGTYY